MRIWPQSKVFFLHLRFVIDLCVRFFYKRSMFLTFRQKTKGFLLLFSFRANRNRLFIPAVIVAFFIGLVAIVSLPATSKLPNPYLDDELPHPSLPLPYAPDELEYFDQAFTELLERHRFNGTVLVARRGMIIYQNAFGYADYRSRTAATTDTPFQLASISKTFTATAVLMLHEEGRIHIDDPIDKHIPEFPYPDMTVRQMLNHTSGIQNYMWLVERYWNQPQLPDNEDVLQLFLRYKRPVNFAAGTRFEYANTGYAFLALLVERVSGMGFAEFLKEHIFDPLNMQNAFAYNPNKQSSMPDHRAHGFRPGRRSFIHNTDMPHDAVLGDKGLYASVTDLYKWDQAIYRHALLSTDTWDQAFEPAMLRNQRTVDYGQGWRLQTFLDGRIVHHPGRWNGFRTSFKRFIDNRATLILLSNNGRTIGPLVDGMQNIIFHQEIMLLTEKPKEDPRLYDDNMSSGGTSNRSEN